MSDPIDLPHWPRGTVAVLATAGPHAIPVSAVLRAGPDRILLGLAGHRDSLARLRADPAVTLAILAPGVAVSTDGEARVVSESLTDRMVAVEVRVRVVHDHDRPTFRIDGGVAWEWTDADARAADDGVHTALRALADG